MRRFTWHGGGLAAAKARFGGETWLDLSTGINPDAWPGANDVPIDWARLPDESGLAALEAAAAAHFGVDPAHVCALPGTEVGLRMAGALLPEPAWHLTPSYRTHGEMFGGSAPLPPEQWQLADSGTLILANPNNPDGRLMPPQWLHNVLATRGQASWLLIDEAFADPDPSASMAGQISDERQLLIFRSFGKFFGLAGLRLGFVLGPGQLLGRFRSRLGAWPVSAAAIAIGTAAYRDTAWIADMRERLHTKALVLDATLGRAGFAPVGQCPLFRLIETDEAPALFERLAGRQILTRPFEDQPRWLRIGLPEDDDGFVRLREALLHG